MKCLVSICLYHSFTADHKKDKLLSHVYKAETTSIRWLHKNSPNCIYHVYWYGHCHRLLLASFIKTILIYSVCWSYEFMTTLYPCYNTVKRTPPRLHIHWCTCKNNKCLAVDLLFRPGLPHQNRTCCMHVFSPMTYFQILILKLLMSCNFEIPRPHA